jgi:hypothetical protein
LAVSTVGRPSETDPAAANKPEKACEAEQRQFCAVGDHDAQYILHDAGKWKKFLAKSDLEHIHEKCAHFSDKEYA